ncbi:MAG: phosphotransferase, partial [Kiritimatiellae bacterium]|nr:phosphotransferase [Kiritimatiellia bacterium]
FRAAKLAHEFVEMIEDDALGNVDKFGAGVMSGILPQVRGALIPTEPTKRSRSRELCLRYLKSSAGIDPSVLSSVSTREIFNIAEAVADDRYSLRTGKVSEKIVRAMLDRTIDLNAMTSQEAIDLYTGIRSNLDSVPGVEMVPIMTGRQTSQMPDDVRDVHEFLADIVFDADPFDFENARSQDPDMRVVDVMRRHVRTLVKIAKKPELIETFPQNILGEISEFMGSAFVFLPRNFVQSASDDELRDTFEFFLDNINKGKQERELAAEEFMRRHLPPRPVQQPAPQPAQPPAQGRVRRGLSRIGVAIKNIVPGRSGPAVAEPSAEQVQTDERQNALKKEMLLASLDQMSFVVKGLDALIASKVPEAMEKVQNQLSKQMSGEESAGNSNGSPVWSMSFEEIVGGAMTDPGSGYGKFMHEVMSTYFTSSSLLDQRRMLASLIRNVDENASTGAMAGALFKGAGPLLQKMLQGLPPAALGEDMSIALEDMKSNLLPLPDSYVKACMRRIIDRSGGHISSIRVERSLGAASVGQAFLCKMVTENHPEGEECVVKLLRPTVKTAIVRERKIFEEAAAKVQGMSKTFEGQLARILDELDLTLESTNVNFGRGVYEQPVYLRQTSLLNNSEIQTLNLTSLHSMEVHPLVTPTMDCLVLKKAPGVTYDRYMKDTMRHLDELIEGKELVNGRYRLPDFAELIHFRKELVGMYNETLKRQRFLIDLTKKWAHEGLFGGGFYHGDLHAGNIMTDGNGLTVIDFGNATHLTETERTHVLRMISAALVGWNEMFESSFKALLSEKGRAEYDARNAEGKISRELAEVLKKGHGNDVGLRIAAALMLLQKNGIEVPGPIYNFNQCQMRLGGTVDAMNALLGRIRSILTRLEIPRIVYDAGDRDSALSELIDPAAEMVNEIMRFVERPFGGGEAVMAVYTDMTEDFLCKFSNMAVPLSECYQRIIEELKDEDHCREHIYPLIEQLQEMRTVNFNDVPMNNAGAGIDLKKMFAEYLKKDERTDEDRKKLAIMMYKVISQLHSIVPNLIEQKLDGIEESFLMAVGESISDSLYTVRTTLGNITSVKLMNAQNAEADLIVRERERMRDSDLRVRSYLAARPESLLDELGVSVIKETAKRMYFPFDLPGLDGRKDWLQDENARRRIYAAILTNVKRLLAELEEQRVFSVNATMATRIEATCIAMQYLVDRVGGLFDAFSGIDNRTQQRIMVELRQFLLAREGHGMTEGECEFECTMMAFLYLFQGGAQPAQEAPVPDLGQGQRPVQAVARNGGMN